MRDVFVFSIIFFGVIGIATMLFQWIKLAIDLKCYEKTEGVIIESEINPRYFVDQDSVRVIHPKKIDIKYQYSVNDKLYKSKKVTKRELFIFSKVNFLEKYPISKKVDVYYDPNKPRDSVLELETNSETYILFCLIFSGFIYAGIQYLLFPGKHGI